MASLIMVLYLYLFPRLNQHCNIISICVYLYILSYLFTHNIEDVMESELNDIQLMNDDPGEWYIQAVLYGKWF